MRYGLDSLGPIPGLVMLAGEVGLDLSVIPAPMAPRAAPAATEGEPLPAGAIPGIPRRSRKDKDKEKETDAAPTPASDPRLAMFEAPAAVAPAAPAAPEAWAPQAPTPPRERVPEPALDANADPLEADMQAAEYIAKGDPRAAQVALIAARHFIADGRTNAASDLLLQLIASGLADHQAQRLLVDVVSSIGKRDVARAKCALLAEALRLDGQPELAVEVERLAQAV